MPSIFGTHPFLILLFIVINLVGTVFILRQSATIATKTYKSNRLALIIKSLCIFFSLSALLATTNLLADSINYVHFANRPITTNYSVTKKDNTLYFKRTMNSPFFVKSSKDTIQSEDYDNYYLSNHLVIPKKAVTERTPS
jgi:hypothetical protein